MNDLVANVSFICDLNNIKCAMPFAVFYGSDGKKIGKIILTCAQTGRPQVTINMNATGEEMENVRNWAQEVFRTLAAGNSPENIASSCVHQEYGPLCPK